MRHWDGDFQKRCIYRFENKVCAWDLGNECDYTLSEVLICLFFLLLLPPKNLRWVLKSWVWIFQWKEKRTQEQQGLKRDSWRRKWARTSDTGRRVSWGEDGHIFGSDRGMWQGLQELFQCQREAGGQIAGIGLGVRECRGEVMIVFTNMTYSLWLTIWISLLGCKWWKTLLKLAKAKGSYGLK